MTERATPQTHIFIGMFRPEWQAVLDEYLETAAAGHNRLGTAIMSVRFAAVLILTLAGCDARPFKVGDHVEHVQDKRTGIVTYVTPESQVYGKQVEISWDKSSESGSHPIPEVLLRKSIDYVEAENTAITPIRVGPRPPK